MKKRYSNPLSEKCFDIIFSSLSEDIACVVSADHESSRYQIVECDEYFSGLLDPEGSLRSLYCVLFSKVDYKSAEINNDYGQFIDEDVFRKDRYQGNVCFDKGSGENYFFRVLNVSGQTSVIVFFRQNMESYSNMIELEKMDTIQESYLFSMIVNLANDTCVNPNTTEISASRQDFMELSYSDWRLMISNMFQDEDKVLFLQASSPENVINMLEMSDRFHIDLRMMNMQGEYIWCRLMFTAMKNFSRSNPRFVYTVSDISDDIARLIRQEGLVKAIEEQNERLKEADKNKTQFFSNMSHEIRTPINAIMGMNEVILRDCRDENIKAYAGEIKAAGSYLLSLVNDILDYSKIEAGKMEIVPVEYNLRELLKRVYNINRSRLEDGNLMYELVVSEDVPQILFGDELRITQILVNLLSNAVKYTVAGKITLTVERKDSPEGCALLHFELRDTGIGIRKEDMEAMFSDYGRLDLVKNRNIEGTGLGIGIVQGLLTRMNSRLVVESEYGVGSVFSFDLLQKAVEAPFAGAARQTLDVCDSEEELPDISGRKLLVVDDTVVNLRVFEAMMAPYEADINCAKSGDKALEMMKNRRYDMVFLDHLMPGKDGVETLKELRAIDEYYRQLPVVAMTGNYSPTAREEYISLGFTDYLEKPISPKAIETIIRKYL